MNWAVPGPTIWTGLERVQPDLVGLGRLRPNRPLSLTLVWAGPCPTIQARLKRVQPRPAWSMAQPNDSSPCKWPWFSSKIRRRKGLPGVGGGQLLVLGSPACSWWRQWRWRHGRRSGRKLSGRRKIETRKKVDFFVNFAPPMHGTHPYLHEHFIFIGDKSWLLIQPRRISTIGSNWSS